MKFIGSFINHLMDFIKGWRFVTKYAFSRPALVNNCINCQYGLVESRGGYSRENQQGIMDRNLWNRRYIQGRFLVSLNLFHSDKRLVFTAKANSRSNWKRAREKWGLLWNHRQQSNNSRTITNMKASCVKNITTQTLLVVVPNKGRNWDGI